MDKTALFVNVVPWRPHGEHAAYIAELMSDNGWDVRAVVCGGGLASCYQKQINGRLFECSGCKLESLNKFGVFKKVDAITFSKDEEYSSECENWPVLASVGTAYRVELDSDLDNPELRTVIDITAKEYSAQVKAWREYINELKPNLVVIFNARFHDAAAVAKACSDLDVKYITHERTWFGLGLQINNNEDCVSLSGVDNVVRKRASQPLSHEEIRRAFQLVASRLYGTNTGEWRNYGQSYDAASSFEWPSYKAGKKVLVVPSSRSEFIGHPDYRIDFDTTIDCLDYFVKRFNLDAESIIIRSHPAWDVPIGRHEKSQSYDAYKRWAEKNGALFIEPKSSVSTYALMEIADFAIFNGGSAVVEAALLGCPSVLLSPSPYQNAGFVEDCSSREKIDSFDFDFENNEVLFALALRYVYARAYDQPIFTTSVKGLSSKEYVYSRKGDEYEDILNLIDVTSNHSDFSIAPVSSLERQFYQQYISGGLIDSSESGDKLGGKVAVSEKGYLRRILDYLALGF